jgi:hypothetical protein
MAGFALLFILAAAGVSIDATFLLVPLTVMPLLLAVLVFVGGRTTLVQLVSAVSAAGYAALGTWNYFRAAAFEEANPGSMEVSGHEVSIAFALLSAMTAAWSLAAAWLAAWRGRDRSGSVDR